MENNNQSKVWSTQKITPFLWFNDNAEEAMNFYVSVFKNAEVGKISRYTDESAAASGRQKGSVMTGTFTIGGQEFIALNGGPQFKFTPAISFVVNCESQNEIDELWAKLTGDGGKEINCGWLEDKFGISWQIVPANLGKMITDKDAAKSQRVMKALLQMMKIDMNVLEDVYNQE